MDKSKYDYDWCNGEKYLKGSKDFPTELDEDEMVEAVVEGEVFIDDLFSTYNDIDMLKAVYKASNLIDIIAEEVLIEIEDQDHITKNELKNEQSLVEMFSETAAEKLMLYIAKFYSTDEIESIFEDDDNYKEFIVSEVDEILDEVHKRIIQEIELHNN